MFSAGTCTSAMDLHELFQACRRGDIEKVRYLVEKKEMSLNVRDKWDSTPLYYACYCGFKELVQYMLANGARCEANTFDGERCIYGALTDDIRNLLRSAKMVTSRIMRRHTYDEFLRKCFESTEFTDITMVALDGMELKCHKCVLASRVPRFCDVLSQNPSCTTLTVDFNSGELMLCLKEFIYTGRMRMLLDDDKLTEMQEVAKRLLMTNLVDKLLDELDKYECERSLYLKMVRHITIEPELGCTELADSFAVLADEYLRKDLVELPFGSKKTRSIHYADVCFLVGGVHFFAHKMFYCQRSEYFAALLRDHFKETAMVDGNIPLVSITNASTEVFACIHEYVYRDVTDRLTGTNAFDVLLAADKFLLTGLKSFVGAFMADNLDLDNAVSLFRCSRIFQLARLEDQCVAFMAQNLDHFLLDEDFRQQVTEDAKEVKGRQETDSIAIIDDIRYHISANVQSFSEIEEANQKLFLIDDFLYKLGLEA
ncbi:ankyrin repeat and BTB/POZ domain-containing protein 1-like isoform X3 [Varroa jacobsoni]|uniref:BTB domain-containing protein n=1 Tax=Varroa destructor TaxID=109461 RepID=A0A7M7MIZ0_VARDE|nr:ankyrin repeat and BTB/POZ domain-containing protein 1-like isoform X2 [Varroa destructor]XP_022701648.1 ankyrin repeat and BTB/POZ domain-containing protein 1-like isoform X3 [Varroa jacobsoni]